MNQRPPSQRSRYSPPGHARPSGAVNSPPSPPPLRSSNSPTSQTSANSPPDQQWQILAAVIGFTLLLLALLLLWLFANSIPSTVAGSGETPAETTGDATLGSEAGGSEEELNAETTTSEEHQPTENSGAAATDTELASTAASDKPTEEAESERQSTEPNEPASGQLNPTEEEERELQNQADAARDNRMRIGGINRKVQFFGVKAEAEHVGFVLDRSSSMAGPAFDRVRNELNKSLSGLSDNQRFTIFLFNSSAIFDRRFLNCPASVDNIAAAKQWLGQQSPDGATYPLAAMQGAFAESCQLIFLLSDGEFMDPEQVASINQHRVPVFTIAYGVDCSTLKQIARENQGRYREVR